MIELPPDLAPELVPLAWLLGSWEGTGIVSYGQDDDHVEFEFGQRISFITEGLPVIHYNAYAWLLDDERTPLTTETGYWRLARTPVASDVGPGFLPGTGANPFTTAESIEALRATSGRFEVQADIAHPDGSCEYYVGELDGPKLTMATDAVLRPSSARDYTASRRMLGLVEEHLLWVWDIAAQGKPLASHASARLARG